MSKVLLITSTIAPAPNTYQLSVLDPVSRLKEYEKSFRFYISLLGNNTVDWIIYADNSGYPIDSLLEIAEEAGYRDKVEFMSFVSTFDPLYDRFYLELGLLKEVYTKSSVLKNSKDQVVWKVTGRYLVKNIRDLILSAPTSFDLYVNCRNYPIEFLDFFVCGFRSNQFYRLFGDDIESYKVFSPSGEVILRQKIDSGSFNGLEVYKRLNIPPRVVSGRRGNDGSNYASVKETFKFYLRRVTRAVAPWLWI